MRDIIETLELLPVEGFDLRADLVPDDTALDGGPTDVADYPDDVVQAYRDGFWWFTGIIVTASRNGIDLGSDSVWGVEYGMMPKGDGTAIDIDPLNDADGSFEYYRDGLIANAIADARMTLSNLADAAIDEALD